MFYLELAQYEKAFGVLDTYYDAIVNIFTRLNKAGRELSREDIAFAWLKTGWNAGATSNNGAKACIDVDVYDVRIWLFWTCPNV